MKYPSQKRLPEVYIKKKFEAFLLEDAPQGDVTTHGIFKDADTIWGKIQAQEQIIFAGEQVLNNCFDRSIEVHINVADGQQVQNGEIIAAIKGKADQILIIERVLLNLLQRLCGIATETRKYVNIAQPYGVKILDTRKTTPGLRLFEKYAVAVAGGSNHRLDLSSGILIKDNHIKAAGSIKNAVTQIRDKNDTLPIEVEVENSAQIKEALECYVDGLLLDNLSPDQTRQAVQEIRQMPQGKAVFIESSGGINLENLGDYVTTGVDTISVGALTHSVKGAEIHMEFYDV